MLIYQELELSAECPSELESEIMTVVTLVKFWAMSFVYKGGNMCSLSEFKKTNKHIIQIFFNC